MSARVLAAFLALVLIVLMGAWILLRPTRPPAPTPVPDTRPSARHRTPEPKAPEPKKAPPPPPYFTGPFKDTVVVPTLDTPMPEGKNVIWCGTFQMAWGELCTKVVREPIRLKDAETLSDRLNAAAAMGLQLPEGTYYLRAGPSVATVPLIQREMAERFPEADRLPLPADPQPDEYISFAYLAAQVPFGKPFLPEELYWSGGQDGTHVKVQAFGIPFHSPGSELRQQVVVLGAAGEDHFASRYAVDLCKDSTPNQVVVACLPRSGSLADLLRNYSQLTSQRVVGGSKLDPDEGLLVPEIAFKIDQRFKEMEMCFLLNKGFEPWFIKTALQRVAFRLDRSGAAVESSASLEVDKCKPMRNLVFNRPFLVILQRRGAEHPFFVLWVENAELLSRP